MGYLVIFETGDFCRYDDIDDDDIQSVIDGYCDIINLSNMTYYSEGQWVEIEQQTRDFA